MCSWRLRFSCRTFIIPLQGSINSTQVETDKALICLSAPRHKPIRAIGLGRIYCAAICYEIADGAHPHCTLMSERIEDQCGTCSCDYTHANPPVGLMRLAANTPIISWLAIARTCQRDMLQSKHGASSRDISRFETQQFESCCFRAEYQDNDLTPKHLDEVISAWL